VLSPDTGEDAAEEALEAADPGVVGDRSLSDYESVNEADLPDENDYIGFDFPRAAEDLTADWDPKVDQAAIDTVRTVTQRQASAHESANRSYWRIAPVSRVQCSAAWSSDSDDA